MDSITAINTVRDSLRTNLVDPYVTAGGNARGGDFWIYSDEPIMGAKFPQIQLEKIDNPSMPITMGPEYWEHEELYINIWFNSKNGFKITESAVEYKNAQLVERYLGKIKTTLKGQFTALQTAGVGGYKHVNTTTVAYDKETQLYYGAVTVRVWYFNNES